MSEEDWAYTVKLWKAAVECNNLGRILHPTHERSRPKRQGLHRQSVQSTSSRNADAPTKINAQSNDEPQPRNYLSTSLFVTEIRSCVPWSKYFINLRTARNDTMLPGQQCNATTQHNTSPYITLVHRIFFAVSGATIYNMMSERVASHGKQRRMTVYLLLSDTCIRPSEHLAWSESASN